MFSDVVFDEMYKILESLEPDYAYESIYNKKDVIEMLANMKYVIWLSDRGLDRTQKKSDMIKLFRKEMTIEYEKRMNIGIR